MRYKHYNEIGDCTVDICRYENLESLGKCFVPFIHTHLPSAFQGINFKFAR